MKGRTQGNLILLFTLILVFFTNYFVFASVESGERKQHFLDVSLGVLKPLSTESPFGEFSSFSLEIDHPLVDRYVNFFSSESKLIDFRRRLERLEKYEDMIKNIFRGAGIPEELIYVSLVESGGNPKARGGKGSPAGLWQLLPSTARSLGLTVNSKIDERLDPFKSTFAVARFFRDLYEKFHSWPLVLAAYNMGEGALMGKIEKYNSKDFFDLARKQAIPKTTKNYVSKVYAAIRVGRKVKQEQEIVDYFKTRSTWSVIVPEDISLDSLAEIIGVSPEALVRLNPSVPSKEAVLKKGSLVNIPLEAKERFLNVWRYYMGAIY